VINLGKKIYIFESCTSTNDLAKKKAEEGEEEGTVIWAKEQTAGRGREGRKWISKKNKGLYFSIILRPLISSTSLFTFLGAISFIEVIKKKFNLEIKLKWPNDLIYERRKLGGILGEGAYKGNKLCYLILGFGINTNYRIRDFPQEMRKKVTSLKIILNKEIENQKLLMALLEKINFLYNSNFIEKELIFFVNRYSFFKKGERIKVKTSRDIIEGEYKGINKDGALILLTKRKQIKIYSGHLIE